MEVHKHPHHVTHKKKWSEYFLEFFMLFLAVFLGFLAENRREHIVEREREVQYLKSLIVDLQNDTVNLHEGFPRKEGRIQAIDSVFLFFQINPGAKQIPGFVLRNIRRTLWDRHHRRNSTTIDQLKNAGGLRLIQKRDVADSIAAYDLKWQRADFWREAYIRQQDEGKNLVHEIVASTQLLPKYREQIGLLQISAFVDTMTLPINTEYLNEYLNFISDQKITTFQDKAEYVEIERAAERLIALIKKEYDLG